MRSALAASLAILLLAAAIPTAQPRSPAKGLTIYYVDTEGGQA